MDKVTTLLNRILLALGTAGVACGTSPPASPSGNQVDAGPHPMFGAEGGTPDGSALFTNPSPLLDAEAGDASIAADGATSDAGLDAQIIGTIRRPFLVGSSLRSAAAMVRLDWAARPRAHVGDLHVADERTRIALAQAWLDDGLQEHASVAAFARSSMLLLAVGAPPEFVEGSQRASLDEVRHARGCFALAARYGGTMLGPGDLRVADALAPMSLRQLAVLTAQEACVGETLGVVLAVHQLERARDPEVVSLLRRIVADETRHAELGWRFVRWAAAQDRVAAAMSVSAIRAAVAATRETELRHYGVDVGGWAAHGRLTCLEARRASESGIRQVIAPALRALAEVTAQGSSVRAFEPS